ncbi:hypothetical protein PR003_g5785 [Phytophthora rubi]|uniref:Cytidine deaminase n=1 Tax=Phytophthora rubi TaxID=129364 RepID=A0A6A3N4B5_9STRA|nr:hypothetical protein PR002_g5988 [Phytophthora rubi]KAE9043912.1 hypothetical protein PR001_g5576 [Phytophthora rubi]KAE9349631.1 hypothetical protein PR003_g5785 [Phytophthora rubi]
MSNQLEDDLRRVLRLARAEARTNKHKSGSKGTKSLKQLQRQPEQRHRHDRHLQGSKGDQSTLLTAKLQGLSAIYGLDTSSRHLGDCSSKSVLYHQHKDDPAEDDQVLQLRLDARRTLYKRHYAGALADSSGHKRKMEHVLEAAAREARSSRALGVGIGAAVLTESETIYAASAIENGAMTLCAERAAVLKMVTSGANSPSPVVVAMAICSEQQDMLPFPCGGCRELLADLGDFPVYLVNALGEREETRSSSLFPRARHSELTQILGSSQSKRIPVRIQTSSQSTNQPPLEVKDWDTEQVLQWLEQDVGLPQYREVFERNNVDGCTLVLLEGSDLQLLLGITNPQHRSKLLTHVDRLRDRELLARGLDYTQLEDYLAVLDIDRVSAVAQLKTTFDRLDADHDGFLDFSQLKQALSRLRCTIPAVSGTVEASAQAVERLLHSEELFGKEAATSGRVSFPAFARAFSKLATQPAAVTQGAFAVHAFGPKLPVLDLTNLRKCFHEQSAQASSLDESGLVRLLRELGQTDTRSTELARRWLDAQDEVDEACEAVTFAQFIARYAQLMDSTIAGEGAEATSVARLQQLFVSYEPVHSTRWKPRTVVQRALSTLFPMVPADEVIVWCASFWPAKVPSASEDGADGVKRKQKTTTTLSFPEFTLACLEFAAEVYAREQEAASIKRSLRNDALVHRSRVVHLHSSGHVRMCPQPPSDANPPNSKQDALSKPQKDSKPRRRTNHNDDDDGKRADKEGKAQDSDDEDKSRQTQRRRRREKQVDEAFDRFAGRHGARIRSAKEDDAKDDSGDDEGDPSCMLNAVEAAQAALELGAALSREQVLRFLEREGLGRIRRRDISRTAFHRLMKRLDTNQSYPRDLLLDIDTQSKPTEQQRATASPRKGRTASKSPRYRAYKTRVDYDEFLRQKLAASNGTQWENEVEALRRQQKRREEGRSSKGHKKLHHRSARINDSDDDGKHNSEDDGKHDTDSDSTGSTASGSSSSSRTHRHRRRSRRRSRSKHRRHHRRHHSRAHSSLSESSTETDTSSADSTRSATQRGRRKGFAPGSRVASMIHGRGTIERVYRDYFVADVHFDSGRHLRNVEFSGLRVLDPEDELLVAGKTGFNVGSHVTVAHKGTKTRRQGKIVLCRTDGTFDVLVNEFGLAQIMKRMPRSALALFNVKSAVYRVGARVMVRQRTEYLRGKVCTCRTDGSYDVKLARSPQKVLQRLAPDLLAPDDGEDADSDDDIESAKDTPATTKTSIRPKEEKSDDEFEPEFSRGDRVEARFGGQASYFPGTIERVHPNGSCDISYDDGDEEERVAPHLIRSLSSKPAAKNKNKKNKSSSDDGYESDLFDSD